MTKFGLLCLCVGFALGLRAFLARLTTGPDQPDQARNFASDQERAWASVGPKVAVACIVVGFVITLIGLLL